MELEHLLIILVVVISVMAYFLRASWRDYLDALLALLAAFGFSAYYHLKRRLEELAV